MNAKPGRSHAAMVALLLIATAAVADEATAARAQAWPDSFLARVEALALLQTLNADLLSHDSATATLERWCDVHRLASPARIVAQRAPGAEQPPSEEQRHELGATADEPVRYRHVKLMCGPVLLSEADNWYVPGRLTAEMNQNLDHSDIAFGRAVQPDLPLQAGNIQERPRPIVGIACLPGCFGQVRPAVVDLDDDHGGTPPVD